MPVFGYKRLFIRLEIWIGCIWSILQAPSTAKEDVVKWSANLDNKPNVPKAVSPLQAALLQRPVAYIISKTL